MQHTMILQRGWPLIERTPHWSLGYFVCLIPVMVVRGAMKAKSFIEEKKEIAHKE